MKLTLYTLVCLLFLTIASKVSAQVPPDTARLSIGLDAGIPSGSITSRYLVMVGFSIRLDYPLTRRSYIAGEAGFNTFFLGDGSTTTQQAILNQPVPLLQTVPLKLGYKYFLFGKFYLEAQGGTSLLFNKNANYATNGSPFTWSPGIGWVAMSKKHHGEFIDYGVRWESVNSFYNDHDKYAFYALHIAWGVRL